MKKRFTTEQIVRKLREAEGKLASGQGVPEVCKELGINESSYYRWKTQYGGTEESEARRLRELERENARLKRIVAEQAIDISISEGGGRGRLLSPARRRAAVEQVVEALEVSERQACKVLEAIS